MVKEKPRMYQYDYYKYDSRMGAIVNQARSHTLGKGQVYSDINPSHHDYKFIYGMKKQGVLMIFRYYEKRYYDLCSGVWLSVDPHHFNYPTLTPYAYVANNPINAIDPDGRDIVVLINNDGAGGFGHMGMLVGNDKDGWVYMSKDGRVRDPETGEKDGTMLFGGEPIVTTIEFEKGQKLQDVLGSISESDGYNEALHFTADSETDAVATNAFEESANSRYHVLSSNCGHAVENALEAVGIETGNRGNGKVSAVTPNQKYTDIKIYNFDFLKENNPVEILIDGQ